MILAQWDMRTCSANDDFPYNIGYGDSMTVVVLETMARPRNCLGYWLSASRSGGGLTVGLTPC